MHSNMADPMVFQVCDEIRREENRKLSLMGIYHRNAILLLGDDVPTLLPKLFFYLLIDVKRRTKASAVEIVDPNGEITYTTKAHHELVPSKKNVLAVGIYPFQIPVLGQYELILRNKRGTEIFRGTFTISRKKPKR
ncbi:hypothetical protein MYX82_12950, partial [Acidobacteria bacterium AH-259-D05]|nr:hypothetical protein [Acidobacteria bacterium AH-259-D05]